MSTSRPGRPIVKPVALMLMVATTMLSAGAAASRAHEGPRIWIGSEGGKIVTHASDNDIEPTVYIPSRIFSTELNDLFGIHTTEFPGFEVRQDGGGISTGTTFGFNITGPLLYYDPVLQAYVTVEEEFGPPAPGPVPQMAVSLGASIRATGSGPVAGFSFFTFNGIGDHSHLSYTLLGDGVSAVDGPSGVYALPMSLTSGALAPSETYYLLIGKDVSQADEQFIEALEAAHETLVPSVVQGDMNCDGALTLDDIPHFVQALVDPDGYDAMHEECDRFRGDLNGDHAVDGLDVRAFTAAFSG